MNKNRQLSLFDLTIIMISMVIGIGIFRTPVNVAQSVATPVAFYAAWVAGGLVALCGSITYAEIGSRMPVTGGYYKVMAYAYHPSIAFAINCIILVTNASALCAVAMVGSEYISAVLVPQASNPDWLSIPENDLYLSNIRIGIALVSILVFFVVNLFGLKMSAKTQNILTIIKLALILLLVSPLFFIQAPAASSVLAGVQKDPTLFEFLKSFGVSLIAVSFSYGGYQHTINFGAEVSHPTKNIPRGIIFGIITVISFYLLVNYAYVSVIGFDALKSANNIGAIMAGYVFGQGAEKILSVLIFLSVLAFVNVQLMVNPRIMEAMSQDKLLPASFSRRSEKTNTLFISLLVFTLTCALIMFWAKQFDTLLRFTIFLDCFGMAFSAGSIFIIRKKTAFLNNDNIYKMKMYPLIPLVFILTYTFVCISIFLTDPNTSLIGIAILCSFLLIYFIFRRINKP